MPDVSDPATEWATLCSEIEVTDDAAAAIWGELLARYSEPQRHYHTLQHIGEMLAFLAGSGRGEAASLAVRLATFFHDAVYDPRRSDNEDQSAAYCEHWLIRVGVRAAERAVVRSLIMATAGHSIEQPDSVHSIFLDADLSILGREATRYNEYAAQIRSEYAFVSDADYCRGRSAVLRTFLGRKRLYMTADAARRLEEPARENLRRELTQLEDVVSD